MSAILKFDFQKREQLRFSEVNYLNYKKYQILHVATNFPQNKGKQEQTMGPLFEGTDLAFTPSRVTI